MQPLSEQEVMALIATQTVNLFRLQNQLALALQENAALKADLEKLKPKNAPEPEASKPEGKPPEGKPRRCRRADPSI